jgi:hypothetical protein
MRELFARIGRKGQWSRRRVLAHVVGRIQLNSALGIDSTGIFAGSQGNLAVTLAPRRSLS